MCSLLQRKDFKMSIIKVAFVYIMVCFEVLIILGFLAYFIGIDGDVSVGFWMSFALFACIPIWGLILVRLFD